MICNVIDDNCYIIKVFNGCNDFDIYDHDDIRNFIKDLFNNLLNKYKLSGSFIFNIYIDNIYGMIIKIIRDDEFTLKGLIDIKLKFNLNISFLYEVDYFYLIENQLINQNIYYYDNEFYLEIVNDINVNDYVKLLDNCTIIYDDKINDIIVNGIKLMNIN